LQASSTLLWNGRIEGGLFGSGNNLDSTEGEYDSGSNGKIMINKRDVKQGKVLILYNTIRCDHLYYVSV
jgi:hypothetical protein